MSDEALSEINFRLWILVDRARHLILKARRKELEHLYITPQQAFVLRAIHNLGSKATLSEISRRAGRSLNTICRHTIKMEADGLLNKYSDVPKSNLVRFELTEKGNRIREAAVKTESIDKIFKSLTPEERQQLESIVNKIIQSSGGHLKLLEN